MRPLWDKVRRSVATVVETVPTLWETVVETVLTLAIHNYLYYYCYYCYYYYYYYYTVGPLLKS